MFNDTPPLRQDYENKVSSEIRAKGAELIASGMPLKDVAQTVVDLRNNTKIDYIKETNPELVTKVIIPRNMAEYGNPVGPDLDYLVNKAQSQGLQGDDIWKSIIDSASRPGGKDIDFINGKLK